MTFYLPQGTWTSLLTGRSVPGGGWRIERHELNSLPLYVREGAVLPIGSHADRPDYDYLDGLTLRVYPGAQPRDLELLTVSGERVPVSLRHEEGAFSATAAGRTIAVQLVEPVSD